ncbi:MAG TPA: site-2 protease family protein [Solirubrobacteraceae bacterium]|jgi:Zn-dependent protease|nr:site-2 protease family protein [Solirubrobacteraceae bacterium]
MDSGLDLDAPLSSRASPIPSAPSLTPADRSYPSHTVAHHATLQPFPAHPPGAADSADEDPFGARRSRVQTLRKRIGGMVAAIVALIAKFFAAIKGLLLLLPKVKLLTTTGTALVSVAAYSLFFGWEFAAGFVLLLFVHEMGHVIQLRREGVPASAPMFIPGFGAVVMMKSLPDDALAEARVGLAGPILGTLGAAVCLAIAEALNSDLLRALAYVAFFLNLINLIPVVPFDGGRAMAAMAPWMWFLGLSALVALLLISGNPFLLIFLLLGFMETRQRWKQRKTRSLEQAAYYRVAPRHRVYVGAVYIGLIVVLVLGMDVSHILASGGHSFGSL